MDSIGFGGLIPWIGVAIVVITLTMVVVNRRINLTALQLTQTTILLVIGIVMIILNDNTIKHLNLILFGQHLDIDRGVQQVSQVQYRYIPDIKHQIQDIRDTITLQGKANADIFGCNKSVWSKYCNSKYHTKFR
jgi:hypothetical protein